MWTALLAAALAAPDDCAGCHDAELAQWRTSRHAVAATNPVFTASWEHWPNGWCLQCHAPGPQQQRDRLGHVARPGVLQRLPDEPPGERWRDGVDCAACHLDGDRIRTASAPDPAGEAAHDLVVDPTLTDGTLCAGCHEFRFQRHTPRLPFAYGDALAQSTVREWRSSRAAADGVGCTDCHMGEHGHAFPGAHTPELVRDALAVEVRRVEGGVVATVRASGAAHRVPTGDPFRRLELRLCADRTCTQELATRLLRRAVQVDGSSWSIREDTTVPPQTTRAPAERTFYVDAEGARWWRLDYRFGDRRFEATLPPDEVGFLIAEGPVEDR